MSKKRTSAESNDAPRNDARDGGGGDNPPQRPRIQQLPDTTLEDLPLEMLERILVKAVTMEVWELKLAKSVWKEKADVVLSRLGNVCPHWSSILESDLFRNELHRVLDDTAQRSFRMAILRQQPTQIDVRHLAVLREDMYLLFGSGYINVYDSNDLSTAKEMISLEVAWPVFMTACGVSNCLYVMYQQGDYVKISRTAQNDHNEYIQSLTVPYTWIPGCAPSMSVASDGRIILQQNKRHLPVLHVFGTDGILQNKLTFEAKIQKYSRNFLVPKSNGNLLLVSISSEMKPSLIITEIDMNGSVLRQSGSLPPTVTTCQTDDSGRILLSDFNNQHLLLDQEFNLLEFDNTRIGEERVVVPRLLFYNSARNEVVTCGRGNVTISRLIER